MKDFPFVFFIMWCTTLLYTMPTVLLLTVLARLWGFTPKDFEYLFNTYFWIFFVVNFILAMIASIRFLLKQKQ